jgi:hypothetical protein
MKAGQERIDHMTKQRSAAAGGEVIDLTVDNVFNYDFFSKGPGYDAL